MDMKQLGGSIERSHGTKVSEGPHAFADKIHDLVEKLKEISLLFVDTISMA